MVVVLIVVDGNMAAVLLDLVRDSHDALGDEIDDLADVEDDAEGRCPHHEVCEDPLFGGVSYVAVHHVGTRHHLALDQSGQVEAVVDAVEDVEEADLDARLGEEAD